MEPISVTHTTQADRVFARFGGAVALIGALERAGRPRARSSVYRWNHPRPHGTGGCIPTSALQDVLAVARLEGVYLTPTDLHPGRLDTR